MKVGTPSLGPDKTALLAQVYMLIQRYPEAREVFNGSWYLKFYLVLKKITFQRRETNLRVANTI